MTTEVWGQMPKSSEDAEKVEEAIDRVVGEHNDDPTSHLGPTQALQSHRATEIIDHVARSVVGDKINSIHDLWDDVEHGNITDYADYLLTDDTKNWVINEWVGHYVINTEDDFRGDSALIIANTENTLTLEYGFGDFPNIGALYIITRATGVGAWTFYDGGIASFNARGCQNSYPTDYIEASWDFKDLILYCGKGPDAGKLDISIDGEVVDTVDLYASATCGRVPVFTTRFEFSAVRTVRLTIRSDKNPYSIGRYCYIQSLDFNGVMSFSSLSTAMLSLKTQMNTNNNGYVNQLFRFGVGYSYVAMAGIHVSGLNSAVVITPKVFYYPSADGVYVFLDDGQPNTTFTVSMWALCAINDSYIDV